MKKLSIDIETFSSIDLARCGVYKYCDSADFKILLFAYAFNDEKVEVIDLAQNEEIPEKVEQALTDPNVIKTAFNANFERTCLKKYFNKPMPPSQWRCTAVLALTLGLPGNLAGVTKCLKLPEEKMQEGKDLIKFFSIPINKNQNIQTMKAAQTAQSPQSASCARNLPQHNLKKWQTFKEYCKQDVVVEREIRKKLEVFPIPAPEQKLWELDQKINDNGVRIDGQLVENAIECAEIYHKKRLAEAASLTGLANPNSPAQLKDWLAAQGIEVISLAKDKVKELLATETDPKIIRVLELRQEMSKTSVKKYEAMDKVVCSDGKIKGMLQFYGAATGRWAGRVINPQNLPRNEIESLDLARRLIKSKDYKELELTFDSVPDTLSQLIRTAFIPSPHARFIVSDFSSIEARVIAWLAGEKWRIDVFNDHGKIYEASASEMFNVPLAEITKDSELRQKGKIAELALGYQGSTGALKAMGALGMGLAEEELKPLVDTWRSSNPKIVKLWRDVENAAIKAVTERTTIKIQFGLKFSYQGGILFITLPSGRSLAYLRPRVEINRKFNTEKLTYEGVVPGSRKWGRVDTYGGKLVENIIQGLARDCLAIAMLRLDKAGYKISFHVHDEVILDVPKGTGSKEEVEKIMAKSISWAPGLPLNAESFETNYYMKE
ncbi:DNA polymerase [Desulfonispora thiosulfatigenes DSM 11270]|uniref:DNA-directed DNA polymerase n=1 Tax=Desulfonispora thiosulfatigenes DSM 11270 TaxID=656914 RepID=A0A1W1V576_DESTI|nr:DNA polymerase [Desulfonispora thiosulfatigenes]SMB88587.1 DNA polymerase [Desulfonispora thiosulfatigenes DSM 11270]